MSCAVATVSFTAHMWCPLRNCAFMRFKIRIIKYSVWPCSAVPPLNSYELLFWNRSYKNRCLVRLPPPLTHLLFLYSSYRFCGFPQAIFLPPSPSSSSPLSLVDLAALSFPLIRLSFLFFRGLISISISPSCVLTSDPCMIFNEVGSMGE